MSQVLAIVTLVGAGLYGLSTLFSANASPLTSTNAQGTTTTLAQNAYSSTNPYSLNNQTKYGGKSKRIKRKGRLTKRKKH